MDNTSHIEMSNVMSLLKISFLIHEEGFDRILLNKNIKTGQLTGHRHLSPWQFQQIVGRPNSLPPPKKNKDIINEELQHCYDINCRVLHYRMVSNKISFRITIYEYFLFPFLLKKQMYILSRA